MYSRYFMRLQFVFWICWIGKYYVFMLKLIIVGYFLDQKRLKQGLYRYFWDDISYIMSEIMGLMGEDIDKI